MCAQLRLSDRHLWRDYIPRSWVFLPNTEGCAGSPRSRCVCEARSDPGTGGEQRLWEEHHCPAAWTLLRPRSRTSGELSLVFVCVLRLCQMWVKGTVVFVLVTPLRLGIFFWLYAACTKVMTQYFWFLMLMLRGVYYWRHYVPPHLTINPKCSTRVVPSMKLTQASEAYEDSWPRSQGIFGGVRGVRNLAVEIYIPKYLLVHKSSNHCLVASIIYLLLYSSHRLAAVIIISLLCLVCRWCRHSDPESGLAAISAEPSVSGAHSVWLQHCWEHPVWRQQPHRLPARNWRSSKICQYPWLYYWLTWGRWNDL